MTTRLPRRARAETKPIAEKHRPTEGELTARIDTVYSLLISGTRRAEICQFASERWHVDERQADRYIAEATKLIKAEAEKDRAETFGEHIAYRRKLRKLAEGDKDWRAALASAQDEAKLLDLYPDSRLKVIDWKSEVLALLRSGAVTAAQVIEEFGESDDVTQILIAAGAIPIQTRTSASQGGSQSQANDDSLSAG